MIRSALEGKDTRPAKLRRLLREKDFLVMPGCFNALSARLIEQAGFDAIYISGAGLASNFVGVPDIGLVSMAEVLQNAKNIVQVTTAPVVCDVDTGFGNAVNMIRTIREFESAGLAGVQIEDQVMPKKCGHTEGKQLISKEEMVQKIKAAVDTRKDPDFLLIARTDAIAVNGFEDALDRGQAYYEAGADVIFVEAPRNKEEMRKITQTIRAPHLANIVDFGGKTPILPVQELRDLGFKMAIYPGTLWAASIKAMQEVLQVLKEDGTAVRFYPRMISFPEIFEIVGRSAYSALEKKYSAERC